MVRDMNMVVPRPTPFFCMRLSSNRQNRAEGQILATSQWPSSTSRHDIVPPKPRLMTSYDDLSALKKIHEFVDYMHCTAQDKRLSVCTSWSATYCRDNQRDAA